jgi:hypothetical protein
VLAFKPDVEITFDIRDTWQARVLARSRGIDRMVMLSVLAHNYEEALLTLCAVIFPDFDRRLPAPYLESCGRIAKNGGIVAKVRQRNGTIKEMQIYRDELTMRDAFRFIADVVKLSDDDRLEMFIALQKWVVADRRLDPTMDPKDPDAKRLVH